MEKNNEKRCNILIRSILREKERGITLISLMITIIVLLILAGVALSLTLGERGIFRVAKGAAKNYTDAEKEEQEMLDNFMGQLGIEDEKTQGYAYAKLYTRKDGTGDVLVFSSKPDYVETSSDLTLKEDYGNVGKEKYYARYQKGFSGYRMGTFFSTLGSCRSNWFRDTFFRRDYSRGKNSR